MSVQRSFLIIALWALPCLVQGSSFVSAAPPSEAAAEGAVEFSNLDAPAPVDGNAPQFPGEPEEVMPGPDSLFEEDPAEPSDPTVDAAVNRHAAVEEEINHARTGRFLSSFKLPDKLEFAGQPVPLDNWQVRERIEFEFYQFLDAEGESIIIAKRTGRCFPPVEKQLAEAGLPDDLKYMLLVESKCVAAAYSRKRASGPWQFIRSTGRRYKLKSNKWRDERRNLELSTEAAIKYLSHLHKKLDDWYLAMAAYNAGERRITKRLKEQKVKDYWTLHYVRETMRYVPRIIAAKEIFSQPEKYLGVSKEELYSPLDTETVTVRVKKRKQHLAEIAERHGTYFLELKMLNPELRRSHLPRGTYKLKIPKRECPHDCLKQDDGS